MNTVVLPTTTGDVSAPARLLAMQRRAYERDGPPALAQRLAALKALDGLLRTNAELIASTISADFGNRSAQETALAELVPSLAAIRNARRNLRRWIRPERRHVDISSQPGRAWVEWHPLGCVAIVSPWNYPLLLTVSPLVDALAAGNRVIVKPSEMVPRFSALFSLAWSPRRSTRRKSASSPAARAWRRRSAPSRSTTCCSPAPPPSAAWSRAPRPRR